MTNLMESVKNYEDILNSLTETDRDNMDETNPIIHAETGPNRFATMSLFFNETDGVTITEDLELGDITIEFFNDKEKIDIVEGPLYRWALKFFNENWNN